MIDPSITWIQHYCCLIDVCLKSTYINSLMLKKKKKKQVSWKRRKICVVEWERPSVSEQSIGLSKRTLYGSTVLASRREQRNGEEQWRSLDSSRATPFWGSSFSWHPPPSLPAPYSPFLISSTFIHIFLCKYHVIYPWFWIIKVSLEFKGSKRNL